MEIDFSFFLFFYYQLQLGRRHFTPPVCVTQMKMKEWQLSLRTSFSLCGKILAFSVHNLTWKWANTSATQPPKLLRKGNTQHESLTGNQPHKLFYRGSSIKSCKQPSFRQMIVKNELSCPHSSIASSVLSIQHLPETSRSHKWRCKATEEYKNKGCCSGFCFSVKGPLIQNACKCLSFAGSYKNETEVRYLIPKLMYCHQSRQGKSLCF